MKIRTIYLRDANECPVGTVVITVNRHLKRASYQMSVVHPSDTMDKIGRRLPFNSDRGRLMALERLFEKPISVPIKNGASMNYINHKVMKHIASSNAPNRAIKSAKLWLLNHRDLLTLAAAMMRPVRMVAKAVQRH